MSTNIKEQTPVPDVSRKYIEFLEAELCELEDAYADCLADNVDAKTLATLWARIKAIKRKIAFG